MRLFSELPWAFSIVIYHFRSIEASTVVFNCFSELEHPKKNDDDAMFEMSKNRCQPRGQSYNLELKFLV